MLQVRLQECYCCVSPASAAVSLCSRRFDAVVKLMHASCLQGTVLIKNAEELQSYSQGEEDRMEQVIKGIADS